MELAIRESFKFQLKVHYLFWEKSEKDKCHGQWAILVVRGTHVMGLWFAGLNFNGPYVVV